MHRLVSVAVLAGIIPVVAQAEPAFHPRRVHLQRLPPVSGVITMAPNAFAAYGRPVIVRRRAAPLPRVVTGGLWPRVETPVAPYGYSASAVTPAERWATGGTGLLGLIGNTGNPFAGQARWGTADSATSGPGLPPSWAYGGEAPLVERYGEAAILPTAYDVPSYGAAPQLGSYGSGRPSTMAYYSSGSSAGPYGSPGGLATYRSGSYGYGPRIIRIPGRGRLGQTCPRGPRIIHLGRHHHAVMID